MKKSFNIEQIKEFWLSKLQMMLDLGWRDFFITCNPRNLPSGTTINWSMCQLGLEYDYGVSKMVFIAQDCEFVLKIPLRREAYCQIECDNYAAAEEEGLERFFAACYSLGDWVVEPTVAVPLFIMEKVSVNPELISQNYEDSGYPTPSSESSFGSGCKEDVICWMESEFTEEAFFALSDFCSRRNIFDIHSENVGWDKDDNFVLIDYSGC